jgi:N-acyl-D-aspartate/D-glutamate deacylase
MVDLVIRGAVIVDGSDTTAARDLAVKTAASPPSARSRTGRRTIDADARYLARHDIHTHTTRRSPGMPRSPSPSLGVTRR